jgi:hypothetical protein
MKKSVARCAKAVAVRMDDGAIGAHEWSYIGNV